MSAENLLLLLDECDEFNIVVRELLPAVIGVMLCLLVGLLVDLRTGSLALALSAIVASAWLGLILNWLLHQTRAQVVPVTPTPRIR